MLDASLELGQVLDIAHKHDLPVIVDAAAELPPKHHLWSLANAGADLTWLKSPRPTTMARSPPSWLPTWPLNSYPY